MDDIKDLSDKELLKTIGNFIENAPITTQEMSAPDGTEGVTTCQCCGWVEPGYSGPGDMEHYDHCRYKNARSALVETMRRQNAVS